MPNANSLANLRPPWHQGQSGNRKGRPNSGGSLIEYVHELMDEAEPGVAKYTLEELSAIAADHRASHPKAIAAQLILLARTPGFHEKSGKPYCAVLVDMILDRTVGKPIQAVHVTKTSTRPPAEIDVDLAELMGKALASMAPAQRAQLLAPYLHSVDGEAEALE